MISNVQEQKIGDTPQQPANHKKASDPSIGLRLTSALTTVNFLILCIVGLGLMFLTLTLPVLKDATQGPVLLLTEVIQQIGIALFVTSIVSVVVTRLIENTRKELQEEIVNRLDEVQQNVASGLAEIGENARNQTDFLKVEITNKLETVRGEIKGQTDNLVNTSESLQAMESAGISHLYKKRGDAIGEIKKDLEDQRLSTIQLIGISLNDFVQGNGVFHGIWKIIADYARGMQQIARPQGKLDIQILIIDPDCQGAYLRAAGERRDTEAATVSSRLALDLHFTRDSLYEIEEAVKKNREKALKDQGVEANITFAFRFYQVPPICFLLRTNVSSYVQSYYFWDSRDPVKPIPLFRFEEGSEMHRGMGKHFEWLWSNASISSKEYIDEFRVGADKGLRERGVINMFHSSKDAVDRIRWLISNTEKVLYIEGFSLRSYFDGDGQFYQAIRKVAAKKQVKIKILLIDPDSVQAQYRSWREHILQREEKGEIPLSFEGFKAGPYQKAQLYSDTERSVRWLRSIASLSSAETFQYKWFNTAPYCFMLMSDESVLVEQYHYGKMSPQQAGMEILGRDMPIHEYKRYQNIHGFIDAHSPDPSLQTYKLMKSHFEFVFEKCAQDIPDAFAP
ncbi:MAG TPA: hypothetical protein VFQ36_24895 [Ktedonobacteraceae bacterium]|nr:hypothetical protein [Ktedonobacteraceae bacterium]